MTQLSAAYLTFHVNYLKSVPAQSFLMFIQGMLLDHDAKRKRSAKCRTFISAIKDDISSVCIYIILCHACLYTHNNCYVMYACIFIFADN